MPVVKKTVAILPEIDDIIRKLWATMIGKGYDATYSTALNALILGGWIAPEKLKNKEWKDFFDSINSFLNDPKAANEINSGEFESRYGKSIRTRARTIAISNKEME